MIKLLHSADWHLDAPMSCHSQQCSDYLHGELQHIPEKIVGLARAHQCQFMLLSGDLFDGAFHAETVRMVQRVLKDANMPVFIAPGNHDPLGPDSPYSMDGWPDNVHIFTEQAIRSVSLPGLDCKIYGAGYTAMDCPALLSDFRATGTERWHIGVLHGEADTASSHYCPITKEQIRESGLSYLALGHIHKGGSLRAGDTVCAWPGCPMGKGFDETGAKGAILVTLGDTIGAAFHPLDTPRFYDEQADVASDPVQAVEALLPALPSEDVYRITLNGYSAPIDIPGLYRHFAHVPYLTIRDETLPEMDLWSGVDDDSLEGVYFSLLQQAAMSDNPELAERAILAARISRQILSGQEVKLP